jgi:hypothetical protein
MKVSNNENKLFICIGCYQTKFIYSPLKKANDSRKSCQGKEKYLFGKFANQRKWEAVTSKDYLRGLKYQKGLIGGKEAGRG